MNLRHRRLSPSALIATALVATTLCAGARAQGNPPLDTVLVASGLASPVCVTAPAGDTSRLFIVEKNSATTGRIRLLTLPAHVLQATPYLSIGPVGSDGEEGLLGLAFHPDFASNGFLYAYFTNAAGDNQVVRYTANAPFATSTTADASSAMPVITFAHPVNSNHNGGWIGFGPDDLLYIATGDGGSADDPPGNAQNIDVLLGKLLRIDVDGDEFPLDPAKNYRNPPGNPFAGAIPGLDEIWHIGLRNPWRCGFDRTTGDLWIGDVGQALWEEIDVQPAGLGGLNFGWRCMESFNCTGLSGCTCNAPALTPPVHAYSHAGSACAVTGGYVYRGNAICGLQGEYFFADFCSGDIGSFRYQGAPISTATSRTSELAPGGGLSIALIASFGEDANGELYLCDLEGEVFKVVPGAIADCDGNGQHDPCEIAANPGLDANANYKLDVCEFSAASYCPGDGTGTPCPCGNSGAALHGCENSLFPGGARLDFTGQAIFNSDTLTLVASDMPNGTALFYQGTLPQNGGAGATFGDGLRCATGAVIRFKLELVSGNQAAYPGPADNPISVAGGISNPPQTRYYQGWYRNGNPSFCTADTFNLTNGLRIVWGI